MFSGLFNFKASDCLSELELGFWFFGCFFFLKCNYLDFCSHVDETSYHKIVVPSLVLYCITYGIFQSMFFRLMLLGKS